MSRKDQVDMYGNVVLRFRGEDRVDCIGLGTVGRELKPWERVWTKKSEF